jgi:hypothetical protein
MKKKLNFPKIIITSLLTRSYHHHSLSHQKWISKKHNDNNKKNQITRRKGLSHKSRPKDSILENQRRTKPQFKKETPKMTLKPWSSSSKPLKRPLLFLDFYVQTGKKQKSTEIYALHNSNNHNSVKFIKRAKTQMIKTMIIITNHKKFQSWQQKSIKQTNQKNPNSAQTI